MPAVTLKAFMQTGGLVLFHISGKRKRKEAGEVYPAVLRDMETPIQIAFKTQETRGKNKQHQHNRLDRMKVVTDNKTRYNSNLKVHKIHRMHSVAQKIQNFAFLTPGTPIH